MQGERRVAALVFEDRKAHTSMPLLSITIVLIVVGLLLWLVNSYIPMDSKIRGILNAVVVIIVVLWLLQAFGLLSSLNTIRVS